MALEWICATRFSVVPIAAATSFIVRSERVPRHHHAHARRKVGKSKRLLDKVVRAAIEHANAFRDARATCENQDRQRLGSFAKGTAKSKCRR
jgi:hypothetical protein